MVLSFPFIFGCQIQSPKGISYPSFFSTGAAIQCAAQFVFSSKPLDIKLKVKKKFVGYFVGRRWHKTQKESYDKKGNLIIELKVPIGMDLVSWIIGWNEAIKVMKPVIKLILKSLFLKRLKSSIGSDVCNSRWIKTPRKKAKETNKPITSGV